MFDNLDGGLEGWSVWKPAKTCHDFNNVFTLFTAVPVLSIVYTNKDSNLISDTTYVFNI